MSEEERIPLNIPEIALALFLIVVTSLLLVGAVKVHMNREVETNNLESYLFVNRLLYSPNCLSISENDRAYPGSVNLMNFDEVRLGDCASKKNSGARVFLSDLEGNEIKRVEFGELKNAIELCGSKGDNFQCNSRRIFVPLTGGSVSNAVVDIEVIIKDE